MCRHPPFRQNQPCPLNNPITVHRLWSLMKYEKKIFTGMNKNSLHIFRDFAYDNQIRNDLVELYQTMFGLNRPNCLPILNEVKMKRNHILLFLFCCIFI